MIENYSFSLLKNLWSGLTISLIIILIFGSFVSADDPLEVTALINFYTNTQENGAWTNSNGWTVDPSVCTWNGILCDDDDRVISITLDNNNLVGIIDADYIAPFSRLESIDLSDNALYGPIPFDGLFACQSLSTIDLSNNELTGTFWWGLGILSNIESINFRNNFLNGPLPGDLGLLTSLTSFDVSNNQLEGDIPSNFGISGSLTSLHLEDNSLTGIIPESIVGSSSSGNMVDLDLSNNDFTGWVPTFLEDSQFTGVLDLSGIPFFCPIPTWSNAIASGATCTSASMIISDISPRVISSRLTNKISVVGTNFANVDFVECSIGNSLIVGKAEYVSANSYTCSDFSGLKTWSSLDTNISLAFHGRSISSGVIPIKVSATADLILTISLSVIAVSFMAIIFFKFNPFIDEYGQRKSIQSVSLPLKGFKGRKKRSDEEKIAPNKKSIKLKDENANDSSKKPTDKDEKKGRDRQGTLPRKKSMGEKNKKSGKKRPNTGDARKNRSGTKHETPKNSLDNNGPLSSSALKDSKPTSSGGKRKRTGSRAKSPGNGQRIKKKDNELVEVAKPRIKRSDSQIKANLLNVSLDDFTILKVIGQGGAATVMQVQRKGTNEVYAMKALDKEKILKEKQVLHTKAERDALANLRHPFIVRMYHAFQNEQKVYFILEFIPGGELFTHLAKEKRFTEERTKMYAAELILAIEYLHENSIIYRDLKPENILLQSDGHLCVTDFGLIKTYNDTADEKTHTFCGTPVYFAPEVIEDQDAHGSGYGSSCDWWTLGILIYEMLVGRVPWKNDNLESLFSMILHDELPFPPNVQLSSVAKSLINGLLAKNVTDRLGVTNVKNLKQHPFFKGLNWDKIYQKKYKAPFVPNVSDSFDTSNIDKSFTNMSVPKEDLNPSTKVPNSYRFSNFTFNRPDLG